MVSDLFIKTVLTSGQCLFLLDMCQWSLATALPDEHCISHD